MVKKYNYKKKENGLNQTGRPLKFDISVCDKLIKFFDIPLYEEKVKSITSGKNFEKTEYEKVPNRLPTFERFCIQKKIPISTFNGWKGKIRIPEFQNTLDVCKEYAKSFIVDNALANRANPIFSKFVAVNYTDMQDKVENINTELTFEQMLKTKNLHKFAKKFSTQKTETNQQNEKVVENKSETEKKESANYESVLRVVEK